MINVRHRVMPCDFVAAAKEAHCISECINIAAAGMAMDDLNMVRDRLKDALRSVEELDRLSRTKKSFDLAGEFLSKTAIEAYEKQMGGLGGD
ncbi:MAG TPA: hypothetical protein VF199_12510 [Bacillales bacterium]